MKAKIALFFIALLVSIPVARSAPLGVIVQNTDYGPATKTTTVHLLNVLHKQVTAFDLAFRVTFPDGTVSSPGFIERDFLGAMTNGQSAFEPGSVIEIPLGIQQGPATALIDVVVYADGTAEVVDQWAFNDIILERKGRLAGLQKINDVLSKTMTSQHPALDATTELKQELENTTEKSGFYKAELQSAINNLSRPYVNHASEIKSLSVLVERNKEAVAKETAHTQLKAVQP